MPRVLHVLAQRPGLTGSGITLDALTRHAEASGWQQAAVVGTPADDPEPRVAALSSTDVRPLVFGSNPLAFEVPGMSDVMPYASTRFSAMTADHLARYRSAWRDHLEAAIRDFRPHVIHAHHVWIVASLLKEIAPSTPVVTHCHATGLRQMTLCPHLAADVRAGCAANDAFAVLHRGHSRELATALGVAETRIRVVGAGFNEEIFTNEGRETDRAARLLYVGKLAHAKGLHCLLDAVERLCAARPQLELHIAGSGSGSETEGLRRRMLRMGDSVVVHGQLGQPDLARVMRRSRTLVLPSFYEGLPLVLVEAMACGCRLLATDLPGVRHELAPHLGEALELVPLPPMAGVDTPEPSSLPAFVNDLTAAIERSLRQPPIDQSGFDLSSALAPLTWSAVFQRVETIWKELLSG